MPPDGELLIGQLGLLPYGNALELQRALAAARIDGTLSQDMLLLLEHPPVVTLGRTAKAAHLTSSPEFLAARGVELFEVERGGDVTYHGPGQLVGYPVLNLRRHRQDLHWYLRQVEEALIRALAAFSIAAERSAGFTGVWTAAGRRKIASIGVHVRDWVTWHGFALNVTTDLSYFDLIVPCGITGVRMTSMAQEDPGAALSVAAVAPVVGEIFASVFSLTPRTLSPEEIAEVAHQRLPRQEHHARIQ